MRGRRGGWKGGSGGEGACKVAAVKEEPVLFR